MRRGGGTFGFGLDLSRHRGLDVRNRIRFGDVDGLHSGFGLLCSLLVDSSFRFLGFAARSHLGRRRARCGARAR